MRCFGVARALYTLCLEASLAKMLIYITQRQKKRVENQDFCQKFNDFYFLGIVNPVLDYGTLLF